MNFLTIVPARKNSIRFKNKNISKIKNKILVEYTLNIIKKLKLKNIIISTDSKLILNTSKKKNFNVDYKRPLNLSVSKTSMEDTVLHAVDWFEKKNKIKINHIILFHPTVPIRNLKLLTKIINFYKKNKLESLSSVSKLKINNNCILVKNKKGKFKFSKSKGIFYKLDGNIYIISKNFLKKYKNFNIEGKTCFYKTDTKFPIDIDYKEDFTIAKLLIESGKITTA